MSVSFLNATPSVREESRPRVGDSSKPSVRTAERIYFIVFHMLSAGPENGAIDASLGGKFLNEGNIMVE